MIFLLASRYAPQFRSFSRKKPSPNPHLPSTCRETSSSWSKSWEGCTECAPRGFDFIHSCLSVCYLPACLDSRLLVCLLACLFCVRVDCFWLVLVLLCIGLGFTAFSRENQSDICVGLAKSLFKKLRKGELLAKAHFLVEQKLVGVQSTDSNRICASLFREACFVVGDAKGKPTSI